jgi:hypothetical protein
MGTTLFSCADKMETNKKLMLLVKTVQSISNNCWHDVARKTMQNHVQPQHQQTKVNHVKFDPKQLLAEETTRTETVVEDVIYRSVVSNSTRIQGGIEKIFMLF